MSYKASNEAVSTEYLASMIYPEGKFNGQRPEPLATKSSPYDTEQNYAITTNSNGAAGFVLVMGGIGGTAINFNYYVL